MNRIVRRLRAPLFCVLVLAPFLASAQQVCGNGIVESGEECDPFDTFTPVYGSDRLTLCTCACTMNDVPMPLTLKMGAFYLVAGLAIYGLKGSFKKVGLGVLLRMAASLSLGVALLVWGALEWSGVVAAPFDSGRGVVFSRETGLCPDRREPGAPKLIGRSPAQRR